MKKVVSIALLLFILTSVAFAAPYSTQYLNSRDFCLKIIQNTVSGYNLSTQAVKDDTSIDYDNADVATPADPYTPVTPETVDEEQTDNSFVGVVGRVCVITSVTSTIYNEEKMTKLTYYTNNNSYESYCYIDMDDKQYAGNFNSDYIKVGSVVYLDLNTKGIAKRYTVVAYIDDATGLPVVDETAAKSAFRSSKIQTICSYIVDYHKVNDNIVIELGDENVIVATSKAKLYTVDIGPRKTKVISGDCFAGEVYEAMPNDDGTVTAYMTLSVTYEDESAFVVSYTTPVVVTAE